MADSGCRVLLSIITKFKMFGNINYNTFEKYKLFETGVVPIIDYCSGIWGCKDVDCITSVQNRAM